MSGLSRKLEAEVVDFPPPMRKLARRGLREVEFVVDLGDEIFSLRWWRGLFTILLLGGLLSSVALRLVPLPQKRLAVWDSGTQQNFEATTFAPLAFGGDARAVLQPMTRAVIRLAEPPERPRITVVARLSASGGLGPALTRAGVGAKDAAEIVRLAAAETDIRAIKSGTALDMVLGRRETKAVPRPLESLKFRAAFDLKLELARAADGGFGVKRVPIPIDHTPLRIDERVGKSFHRSLAAAGVPSTVTRALAALLAHRLDFEREVKGADRVTVILEHQRAATGETITGDVLYARLDQSDGDVLEMQRWPFGGKTQWFLADGSSVKKGLMRTPVDGARVTSVFGLRTHPILGYTRFHKGVDFGVGFGTPILAAAGGRVSFAGWHGGHGNYVMLDHGKGLQTAYGHMSKIAVRPGQTVGQGQLIGYVGSTGLSTGPHLHYEVYLNRQAVDPRGAKFVSGPQLAGGELSRFRAELDRMRRVPEGRRESEVAYVGPSVIGGGGGD